MSRPRTNMVRFPRSRDTGLVLSNDEHAWIADLIGPCHSAEVEDFLADAPAVPGGRRLDCNHPAMEHLLDAISAEVHGYMKIDEEDTGHTRLTPKRGSTAERLLKLQRRIEQHLS